MVAQDAVAIATALSDSDSSLAAPAGWLAGAGCLLWSLSGVGTLGTFRRALLAKLPRMLACIAISTLL